MDPNYNQNQGSEFTNKVEQSDYFIDNNINRTPENYNYSRRSSNQFPQVSVPATPRMLSNSFRQTSSKKAYPETPPKQQNPQFPSQVNQMYHTSNTVTNNQHMSSSHRANPSGDTAVSQRLFSPSDNLRRERNAYRNEFNQYNSSQSPNNNTFSKLNNDRSKNSQHSESSNNAFNPNIPIIKINRSRESTDKGFNFIEAYEQTHNDNSLMPPMEFAENSQEQTEQQYPVVVPSTPVKDRVMQSPATQHNITPRQPSIPDAFDRFQGIDEKKHAETGKKYKEFHRKSIGDWEFVGSIGSGSMGKVKVAKNMKTNELCAVKIVSRAVKTFLYKCERDPAFKDSMTTEQYKDRLLKENSRDKRTIREGGLGQIFYHPNICRLFHIWGLTTHYYMLFEYVKGGQLLDYIIQHGSLKEHRVRKFSRGIASAIKYLHGHNIVHRDLKIENILISESGEIKIIDFGLSNFYDVNSELKTFCGSLYFAAPELLKAEPYIGPEVDIWAFGVVMYVLLCGKVPFDNDRSDVLHKLIKEGKVEYPSHISPSVKSLLQRMLIVDRDQRYSIDEIIEHPWMNMGYDYKVLNLIPPRKPLLEIDYHVCEEMVRLFFYEDANELYVNLTTLIQSREYLMLAKLHYDMFGSALPPNSDDDPLLAFHADISLYHLVDEFFDRKGEIRAEEKVANARGVSADNGHYFQSMNSGALASPPQRSPTIQKVSPQHPYQKNRGDMKEEEIERQQIPDYKHQKNTLKSPARAQLMDEREGEPQHLSTGLGLLSPLKAEDTRPKIANENMVYDTNDDKFTFGSLFRRLSSGRKKSGDYSSQKQPEQWKRTHKRTVSEGVPMAFKYDDFDCDKNGNLPALPENAHLLVKREQIRYNSINDSNSDVNDLSRDKNDNQEQQAVKPSSNMRMHPNARAKSLGSKAAVDMMNPAPMNKQNSSVDFKYMSGEQVMAEAARAPKGTMPSIEHPKVFFLKNFFSVQTTSFLPLPLVRYEIMRVLSEMGIKYKEVSGGFMCTYIKLEKSKATDTLEDITSAYLDDDNEVSDYDTGRNNMSRRGSVMRNTYKQQIPQTPKVLSRSSDSEWNNDESGIMETPRSAHPGDVSIEYGNNSSDEMRAEFKRMNVDKNSKSKMMIADDSTYNHSTKNSEKSCITFEVVVVKIPVIGTPGVHLKKIKGNTWYFKALARKILENLNL
ncbi:uncharacterized protein HGUI_02423 [Hanseniaspora guilliermondii]|uniref:non-specific serine/threonine protein kinase n=1 Tax=Hanseniaspora guilliermondii TaxID=56406 RepID=A0A1L0CZC8_9ASCO|nr:uncharacterized protein HGUI_02423 [Hanseniaspora guilliermondii]